MLTMDVELHSHRQCQFVCAKIHSTNCPNKTRRKIRIFSGFAKWKSNEKIKINEVNSKCYRNYILVVNSHLTGTFNKVEIPLIAEESSPYLIEGRRTNRSESLLSTRSYGDLQSFLSIYIDRGDPFFSCCTTFGM